MPMGILPSLIRWAVRCTPKSAPKRFGNRHDSLCLYGALRASMFNLPPGGMT
jgi:hypothetical protein